MKRYIGIRFANNDFYNTVTAFLRNLVNEFSCSWEYTPTYTKEDIVELFNKSAPGLYWLCQNGLQYKTDLGVDGYLKINVNNVYFDEEVTNYTITKEGWDNLEFFYVDIITQAVYVI